MIAIILIYIAGILGILGHWATRYVQSRTASTFYEYLKDNIAYTFASLSANAASSTMITMAITPDMTIQQIAILVGTAYTSGYAMDSKLNKENPSEKPIQDIAKADERKSLNSVLDSDRDL